MKKVPVRILITAGVLVFACTANAQYTQTWWTGNVDGDWTDTGNWTNGVPGIVDGVTGTANQAVFGIETDFTTITIPVLVTRLPESVLFTSDMTESITLLRHDDIQIPEGFTIEVQAGSAAHTITVATTGGSSRKFLALSNATSGQSFINHSANALTLDLLLDGNISDPSITSPWYYYKGTGDIVLDRGVGVRGGRQVLHADFTGTVLLPAGRTMNSGGHYQVYGGTYIIDGTWLDRAWTFGVDGTVTGRGVLGRTTRTEGNIKDTDFSFRAGSLLVPGRPGETGTLAFENHDLNMLAGSAMQFDLLDATDYDRLTFRLEYDGTNETGLDRTKVPEIFLGGDGVDTGVTLDLNFLPGFSASLWQKFELLSGYDEIHGTFLGLPDKHEWDEVVGGDEYTFRIDYGASETTLTVIPEPSAVALLLAGAVGVLALRRRG